MAAIRNIWAGTTRNLRKSYGLANDVTNIEDPSTGLTITGITFTTPNYALDTTTGRTFIGTTGAGAVSMTAAAVATAGVRITLNITSDAGAGRTVTFSTGFRPTNTLVLTASKTHIIEFVSDGTSWVESSRSAGPIT